MSLASKNDCLLKMTLNGVLSLKQNETLYPYHVQITKIKRNKDKVKALLTDGINKATAIIADQVFCDSTVDYTEYTFRIASILDHSVVETSPTSQILIINKISFLDIKFNEGLYTTMDKMAELHRNRPKTPPPIVKQTLATPKKTVAPSSSITNSPFQGTSSHVIPISAVNSYGQTMRIKARVSQKSEKRQFKNGNGHLFSMVLVDKSGDIKSVAFNEESDRLFTTMVQGKCYFISKFRVKPADPKFNKTSHHYEITFIKDTEVIEIDDDVDLPSASYQFIENIAAIQTKSEGDLIDLKAILHNCSDITTINKKKDDSILEKRELTLVDDSEMQIRCTLWGTTAVEFKQPALDEVKVFCATKLKVGDFNGKSLNFSFDSVYSLDETTPSTLKLKEWYENNKYTEFREFTSDFKRIKREDYMWISNALLLPIDAEKGTWVSFACHISTIFTKSLYYAGCPSCIKKIIQIGDIYKCDACKEEHEQPTYRYVSSVNVMDCTGQCRVQLFDGEAQELFGCSANELHMAIKDLDDMDKEIYLLRRVNQRQFMLKCVIKLESYNNEQRKKFTVKQLEPVDYTSYGNKLVSFLQDWK